MQVCLAAQVEDGHDDDSILCQTESKAPRIRDFGYHIPIVLISYDDCRANDTRWYRLSRDAASQPWRRT